MRVLVLFSHPVEESYGSALHKQVVESLTAAGHEVDDCDLYAEGFDPVMSRDDRLAYHEVPDNLKLMNIESYVERLQRAEGLVIVTPVWNFGFPAMLKGYLDRVWVPGVTFDLVDGKLQPTLTNIKKMAAVMTYGSTPLNAFLMGDPPRKIVKRMIRATIKPFAPVKYLAHYDMNNCTEATLTAFLAKVRVEMLRF